MRLEYTKGTFAIVWVLVIAGVGVAVQVASVVGWIVFACLAVLPPVVMWRMWTTPRQSMSESIRSAIR
jgi:hypothetical protein